MFFNFFIYNFSGLYTLKVEILDKPHVSQCIIINRCGLLFKLKRYKAQCLFAGSQTSHWKLELSSFNKLVNYFLRLLKEACPRCWCHSQILVICFFSLE